MRLVIALGGNALLRRGQPMDIETQRQNARAAARAVAPLAREHEVVVTHGNGPQVGLLALQAPTVPLDVLGAESEGLVGYLLDRELTSLLPGRSVATLLTQTRVDASDPAMQHPTKPIGPVYPTEAEGLERGWTMRPDGDGFRRVVPSPRPTGIVELEPVRILMAHGVLVICAGGGGIPVTYGRDGEVRGVEAVVDKDAASALLARELGADGLLLLTDVDAVYADWPARTEPIRHLRADTEQRFAAGSMAPKVAAALAFAQGGGFAAIGALDQAAEVLAGTAGTRVSGLSG